MSENIGHAGGRDAQPPGGGSMRVVVNDEEQYSIWWEGREIPAGWTPTGFSGTRQECLDHIAEVWTDMRPRSVRGGV
ncbi:MbtH family protein [Sphaerimonospora sp. CA-214678]|uniref:MbtH family protein n=1 Tax=Sphaerimonospora sp. CA-214678 TaxID=3240029 RepID=UPI003D8AAD61